MADITLPELLDLEHAGWQSLCESRGGSFYGKLMTRDALFVLVNGAVLTRDQVAGSLDGAPGWESYEITEPRLVRLGGEAATLVYRAEANRADLPVPFVATMSSSYQRVDGELRLAFYQQTTITH